MKHIKILFIVFFLSLSQALFALQIGTFKLLSYQDTPLLMQVDLSLAKDDKIEALKPSIAPKIDYDAAGIPRLPVHDQINVKLKKVGDKFVIELVTDLPIKESYIDLLLQIESEKGRSLREFTVLLDPVPTTATKQSDISKKDEIKPITKKEAQLQEIKKSESKKNDTSTPSKTKTTIAKAGKTLFQIARENSIAGITTEQIAVAIFQINPQAFAKENMNGLMKGKKLILPTKQYFEKLSHLDARKILREQNMQWSEINSKKTVKQNKPNKTSTKKIETTEPDQGIQQDSNDAAKNLKNTESESKPAQDITSDKTNPISKEKDNIIEEIQLDSEKSNIASEEFESSIINEDKPIIEEVIIDDPTETESNPILMNLLLVVFATLGIFLVYLSKKKAKLKQVKNPISNTEYTTNENDSVAESTRFEPENYSFQPNEAKSDDLKVSPLEEPVQIDPTSIVNDSNEENVNNMTSVDAYIYKKNKDNSN
jgi:FimV-like protein